MTIRGLQPFVTFEDFRGRGPTRRQVNAQQAVEARAKDAELAALWHAGCTMQEIADAIGVSRERVRQRLKRVGIVGRRDRPTGWKRLTGARLKSWTSPARQATRREQRFLARAQAIKECAEKLGRTPTLHEAAIYVFQKEGRTASLKNPVTQLAAGLGYDMRTEKPTPYVHRLYAMAGLQVRPVGGAGHTSNSRRRNV